MLNAQKRRAANAAVAEVRSGMVVGLGTGSTAAFAIEAVGRRVREGLNVRAVATSLRTAELARDAGIAVLDFADLTFVDLCIDGVDEIDPGFRAIKGAGGALLREKVIASAATRMIAIADTTKSVSRLGKQPVPVEVLPFAVAWVTRRVVELGGGAKLRRAPNGQPGRTDQGNFLLDCAFGWINEWPALAGSLSSIPGVLGHGLFLDEIDALYDGSDEAVRYTDRQSLRPQAERRPSA